MRTICIADQTLKILAKETGTPLLFREKSAIVEKRREKCLTLICVFTIITGPLKRP